jgi:hypothetical protein
MLAQFLVERGGQLWPDDHRFERVVGGLLMRARWGGARGDSTNSNGDRTVRVFGEMVALLWARGCARATVRLEHLWNRVREMEAGAGQNGGAGFPLLCAYPGAGFTQDAQASLREICACHTQVLGETVATY